MIFVEHHRSTKEEAVRKVLLYLLTCVAVVLVHWLNHMLIAEAQLIMNTVGSIFEISLFYWFVIYVYRNWMCDGTFRFRIDEQAIDCQSPLVQFAQSFHVPTSDVALIGETKFEFRPTEFWVEDFDGNRYRITRRYGNPVREIFRVLKTIRPEIEYLTEKGQSQWFDPFLLPS